MSLHEPALEIAKLKELEEKGFDDAKAIAEVLEVRRGSLATDVDRLLGVVRYYRGRVVELEKLKEDVEQAIESGNKRINSIKEYVRGCMAMLPGEPFKGKHGKFVLRKAGGVTPLKLTIPTTKASLSNIVTGEHADKIPQKYLVRLEVLALNTEAIRKDLEAGIKIEGATLGERGSYIKDEI